MARKVRWGRVALAAAVVAAATGAGVVELQERQEARADAAVDAAWFAPYVDVTATPSYAFEDAAAPARSAVLAFVVADPDRRCEPSWGGAYSLDEAADQLDLDRRVARLRQLGGDVVVSFGGLANHALATACTDEDRLRRAYAKVVDRYDLTTIDLDVEGEALTNRTAGARRAAALAALQVQRAQRGEPLDVWLTLPVDPRGLPADALAVVDELLDAGVELAGVNAMTMDYAESREAGQSMVDASTAALEATWRQVAQVYARHGTPLSDVQAWRKVGVTPMIGQNDVVGEVLEVPDAERLAAFAVEHGLGRASLWSANRDRQCGANWPDPTIVSDACSGVEQDPGAFQAAFAVVGELTPGTRAAEVVPAPSASAASQRATQRATQRAGEHGAEIVDDPDTSPYPIWDPKAQYLAGTKVVRHRYVYEAKWWTTGETPDDPTVPESASPWTLVGPVLPGETPEPQPTLPAKTYPTWDGTKTYQGGARVLLDGVPYQAKWWTQGDDPRVGLTDAASPWRPLTADEVAKVAEKSAAQG